MACKLHASCLREFRMSNKQQVEALDRAFHLDVNSPNAPLPGQFPYRWEVRKAGLIICHWSNLEEYWYSISEETEGDFPGVMVHIIVMLVQSSRLIPSIDTRKHVQAEAVFLAELLHLQHIAYTVPMDDLEQDRVLMRAAMDELDLPDLWKPNH